MSQNTGCFRSVTWNAAKTAGKAGSRENMSLVDCPNRSSRAALMYVMVSCVNTMGFVRTHTTTTAAAIARMIP
jgi:hypothetical protein